MPPTANMPSEEDLSPLFSNDNNNDDDHDDDDDTSSGELFRDKVRTLLEHFDLDGDDHLSFLELGALQKATSGELLSEDIYVMACRALDSRPQQGISLEALKLTYAAEGSDIEKDYYTVFPDRNPKKETVASKGSVASDSGDEGKVYEIGADGTIDVS